MHRAVPFVLVFLTAAARADTLADLGTYERQALEKALAARELEIEPDPHGKVLREIHVLNLAVFGEEEGFLQIFNVFHWTTRERVIEREVILRPGELWDQALIDETLRRLKDPLFTTLAVVVPVRASDPESEVDLLVVTRDIWSLRLNTDFEFQEGVLTSATLAPSENNLFGLRKQAALVFSLDLGAYSIGPRYLDKNLAGTRLQLLGAVNTLFSRETGAFEGTRSSVTLAYPLWSLKRKWGGQVRFNHFDSPVRLFRGVGVRTYDNPDTFEVEEIPWQYHFRSFGTELSAVRQFGDKIKHRVTTGHLFDVRRPSLLDGFPHGGILNPTRERVEVARAAFERDGLPRSERSSALFVRYQLFAPRFVVYRNLNTYDLAEDARLGPDLTLEASVAPVLLGSERDFGLLSAAHSWTFDLRRDGFVRPATSVSARVEGGSLVDKTVSGSLTVAAPRVANLFRVVGRTSLAARIDERGNRFLTLGGDSGLRGYTIGAFSTRPNEPLQVRTITNLELRSMPVRILFAEVGGLLFWDAGHVAGRFDELSLHHDVGFGLRVLIPQAQPFVFRLDHAFPLNGPTAGLPGRFSAGVEQIF
jgi:hypothetical protein